MNLQGSVAPPRNDKIVLDIWYQWCHNVLMMNKANTTNDLPEGVLRSTYLPEDTLGGTSLKLTYENGWYVVSTLWQNLARRRSLDKAVGIYESIIMEGYHAKH